MEIRDGWVGEVWRILEGIVDFQWDAHLDELNTRLGLGVDYRFSTHGPGQPPTFFNGDIDALQPGRWVLAVSLNPHQVRQTGTPSGSPVVRRFATLTEYWNFWRIYNTQTWFPGFYRPLTRVAAGAMGEELSLDNERTYATTRMLFLELCPYASPHFGLQPQKVAELVGCDHGFRIARDILHLAAGEGHPALILVNGNAAVESLAASEGEHVQWSEVVYPSASKPEKRLRHWEGNYGTADGQVPIAGFPFLHTMGGFNSYIEIAQLIGHLRAFCCGRLKPTTTNSSMPQ
jgi:hypothetical protein